MTDYTTGTDRQASSIAEKASFQPLVAVDLRRAAAAVDQPYKNFVALDINDHCIRVAVMEGEFRWHQHPRSDECFMVLEGRLEIDHADGRTVLLEVGETYCIPAGVVHRTRARTRAVNLCFEHRTAYDDAVFVDGPE